MLAAGCQGAVSRPADPQAALIARGERIFFEETFDGNRRTCGTCHRAEENFSLTPAFIATLPPNDPLFVAEFQPALAENFEKPDPMRRFGLILENLDGFDDLPNRFVMRGVPHVLGLRTSVESPNGPRTGWSGDGASGRAEALVVKAQRNPFLRAHRAREAIRELERTRNILVVSS